MDWPHRGTSRGICVLRWNVLLAWAKLMSIAQANKIARKLACAKKPGITGKGTLRVFWDQGWKTALMCWPALASSRQ